MSAENWEFSYYALILIKFFNPSTRENILRTPWENKSPLAKHKNNTNHNINNNNNKDTEKVLTLSWNISLFPGLQLLIELSCVFDSLHEDKKD